MSISREKTQTDAKSQIETGLAATKPIAPPEVGECSKGIGRNRLRDYLFRLRSGVELDPASKEIDEHVHSRCGACSECIIEIESAESFLRGEDSKAPAVTVRVIRQQSDETAQREAIAIEVSRQLAAVLAGPAQSFELKDLREMNMKIRTVSDKEQRQSIARKVADACDARWRRVRAQAGITGQIEAAAAELYSKIRTYIPGQVAAKQAMEVTLEALGLMGKPMSRNFLLYMMTGLWFLNPQGTSTWDEKGELVTLHLPVLKQALEEAPPDATLPH